MCTVLFDFIAFSNEPMAPWHNTTWRIRAGTTDSLCIYTYLYIYRTSRVFITNVMGTFLFDFIVFSNEPMAPWHNMTWRIRAGKTDSLSIYTFIYIYRTSRVLVTNVMCTVIYDFIAFSNEPNGHQYRIRLDGEGLVTPTISIYLHIYIYIKCLEYVSLT